jgi:DNA mismatch repair protein MutS2
MNRHYRALELDKILTLLAKETTIPDAYEQALKIEPVWGLFEVEELLKQTDDAYMLIGRFGAPSFSGLKNVANALRRAQAGGCLTTI